MKRHPPLRYYPPTPQQEDITKMRNELKLHRDLRLYKRMLLPALLLGWVLGAATVFFQHNPLRDVLATWHQRPVAKEFLAMPTPSLLRLWKED